MLLGSDQEKTVTWFIGSPVINDAKHGRGIKDLRKNSMKVRMHKFCNIMKSFNCSKQKRTKVYKKKDGAKVGGKLKPEATRYAHKKKIVFLWGKYQKTSLRTRFTTNKKNTININD